MAPKAEEVSKPVLRGQDGTLRAELVFWWGCRLSRQFDSLTYPWSTMDSLSHAFTGTSHNVVVGMQ